MAHVPRAETRELAESRPHTGAVGKRVEIIGDDEKFSDPRFDKCWGRGWLPKYYLDAYGMTGDGSSLGSGTGVEYLFLVPNHSEARVQSMRARIERQSSYSLPKYAPITKGSEQALRGIAMDLVELYKNPESRLDLAKKLGVPVEKIIKDADYVYKLSEVYAGNIVVFLTKIYESIGPELVKFARKTAEAVAGSASSSALSGAGEVAGAIGSILPWVKLFIDQAVANEALGDEKWAASCREFMTMITEAAQESANNKMPPAWHILDLNLSCPHRPSFTAERWSPSRDQGNAATVSANNIKNLLAIPSIEAQAAVRKWWALASTLMATPGVGPVMSTMASDFWGGTLASDEQVMAVAAPIAVAYGLNIDEFAGKLWRESKGWKSKPEWFSTYVDRVCGNTEIVGNAREIQWAVLSMDAFKLAESEASTKKEAIKLAESEASKPGSTSSIAPWLRDAALGALGTGALFLVGAPIVLAAIPATIGLTAAGVLLTHKQRPSSAGSR